MRLGGSGCSFGHVVLVAQHVLEEAIRRLVTSFDPARVILSGSQARGTGDDRSDVGLLMICPLQDDRAAIALAMDRALRGLGLPRDIVVLTPEEFEMDRHIPGTVARPAWVEGKVLYDSTA